MISIIIPCYNPIEEYLRECINSILVQSFNDYEIILINDGSNEEYNMLFSSISKLDDRILVINQENKGVSSTRNYGVNIAKGEYIVFVDADDLLYKDFLSEAYELVEKTGADVVQGSTFFKNGNYEIEDKKISMQILEEQEKNKLIVQMLDVSIWEYNNIGLNKGKIARGPWCKLIKKDIAMQILFPEDIYLGEDRIWNIDIIKKSKKICIAYRNWYIYRNHNASASHKYDENRVIEYERYLSEIYKLVNNNEVLMDHYRVLVFEVFCEILDGHFFNKEYPNKTIRNKEINKVISLFPWCEIKKLKKEILSSKRRIMYKLVDNHSYKLYHYLRKLYIIYKGFDDFQ